MVSNRHVVVAGGSFAGLAAAYTLRDALHSEDRITVVAPTSHFVFAPSLVRAALGKALLHSSFSLDAALAAKDIDYVHGHVRGVEADDHTVHTDSGDLHYDRLIIATGGRPDTSRVPGLAGEFRRASWVVGEDSAMEARNALRLFFEDPGPLVIGAALGAPYISAAYELALSLDAELRHRGMRNQVPVSFVTSEPYLGHLGIGQTAAQVRLASLFAQRNITAHVGVSVERVEKEMVRLSNGETLESHLAIIMPPFTGALDIWKTENLTDETGMIPVTPHYQHLRHPDIYAAGIASYFAHPVAPLGSNRAPGTGYLSLRMGQAAGRNVAASLECGTAASGTLPYLLDIRIIDGGDTGLLLASRGNEHLHHSARLLPGNSARYLKAAVERYLIRQLRTGVLHRL